METGKLWWETDPELRELTRKALEDLQNGGSEFDPATADEPDPVVEEIYSGACVRGLANARDGLASARAEYEDAVAQARRAGLSWGEIGAVLGVSRQQLHRRFGRRS